MNTLSLLFRVIDSLCSWSRMRCGRGKSIMRIPSVLFWGRDRIFYTLNLKVGGIWDGLLRSHSLGTQSRLVGHVHIVRSRNKECVSPPHSQSRGDTQCIGQEEGVDGSIKEGVVLLFVYSPSKALRSPLLVRRNNDNGTVGAIHVSW